MKKAIIIGAKGQDGRILTSYLLNHNYTVLGIDKDSIECSDKTPFNLVDILDANSVSFIIKKFLPDEIYYLAAFHHSSENKELMDYSGIWYISFQINVYGLINVLEAIRAINMQLIKLFYASSCLVYGDAALVPQNEETPFLPNDVYGISKTAGTHVCRLYRKNYGLFVAVGILYNHESLFRSDNFVSQKIIQAALRIKKGEISHFYLGDLSSEIDWGYAPDFVAAMQLILQLDKADDFVIATGQTHMVRDFVGYAFSKLGLDWSNYVREDKLIIKRQRRILRGDFSKLQKMTGWKPSVSFEQMIDKMLKGDCP